MMFREHFEAVDYDTAERGKKMSGRQFVLEADWEINSRHVHFSSFVFRGRRRISVSIYPGREKRRRCGKRGEMISKPRLSNYIS